MTWQALILGILISTIPGTALHVVRGGNLSKLVYYIFFGWIGFWGGHLAAQVFGWTFASLGPIRLGMALIGCTAMLAFAFWMDSPGRQEMNRDSR